MAPRRTSCQSAVMAPSSETPPANPNPFGPAPMRGGGCLIAAGLVLGPIIGIFFGQVSAGLVAGLVIGVIAAIVLTIIDRRR